MHLKEQTKPCVVCRQAADREFQKDVGSLGRLKTAGRVGKAARGGLCLYA